MAEAGVDAFLVPRADAHQGENVAPRDERLAWLTGFTGSAGLAVVTRDRAVDLRRRPLPAAGARAGRPRPLRGPAPSGGQAGRLADRGAAERRAARLRSRGCTPRRRSRRSSRGARAAADRARARRRTWSTGSGRTSRRRRRGRSCRTRSSSPGGLGRQARRARPRAGRARPRGGGADAAGLDRLASERARLRHRPHPGAARLRHPARRRPGRALHRSRRRPTTRCGPISAPTSRIAPPEAFGPRLDALRGRVAVDQASAPAWVSDRLAAAGAAEVVWERDPCILPKACKTEAEIAGARAAHLRDGAAMAEFLAWLDRTAPEGGLTEIDVVKQARGDPRRHRAAARHLVRDDLRRRAGRRDRALPGDRGVEPRGAPGRAPARRQRRPVRRRHHRHHPHRRRSGRCRPRRCGRSPWC